jgi:hypothetical protein
LNGTLDHLPDRQSFTMIAFFVAGHKPRKTTLWIVRAYLFWVDDDKAKLVCECWPSGAVVVVGGWLTASMLRNDKGWWARNILGQIGKHAQIARVGSEASKLLKSIRSFGSNLHSRANPRFPRRDFEASTAASQIGDRLTWYKDGTVPLCGPIKGWHAITANDFGYGFFMEHH